MHPWRHKKIPAEEKQAFLFAFLRNGAAMAAEAYDPAASLQSRNSRNLCMGLVTSSSLG